MAEGKKSFVLYTDQRGLFEKLSDEKAGQLIKHIYAYCADENPESDFVVELAFEAIKASLKRDLQKWQRQREQRIDAGKASAEKRKRKSTTVNEIERKDTKSTVSVSASVSGSVIKLFENNFWNPYDKKIGKKECLRLWNKLNEGDWDQITKAVPKYVAATPNPEYRKNPYRYLKGEHWKDEVAPMVVQQKATMAV
ncbi:MAG: DUF6291 domain-containing protein [Bacteroidota bacterium]